MILRTLAAFIIAGTILTAAPAPRILAWDYEVAERKLAIVSGETVVEITRMHPLKRSTPLRLRGAGPFILRALDKSPDAEGNLPSRPLAIPENITKPLLVIMPDESHPTGIRPLVIDDNPVGFKWGTYRFVNTTPKDLVIQLENKAVKVAAGWKPVDFQLGGERRGIGARIAMAESIEKPVYTAVWEHDDEVRTLCFLVAGDDLRLSPVMFKAIPENKRGHQLDFSDEPSTPAP